MKTIPTSIRLSEKEDASLQEAAHRLGISKTALIRQRLFAAPGQPPLPGTVIFDELERRTKQYQTEVGILGQRLWQEVESARQSWAQCQIKEHQLKDTTERLKRSMAELDQLKRMLDNHPASCRDVTCQNWILGVNR